MKERWRYQIWLSLGILCPFVILPFAGYGATLTIGDTVSTTGNWTVNGAINATSFSGDGSGLTNVQGTGGPSSLMEVYDANDQFLGYSNSFPTGTFGHISGSYGSPSVTGVSLSALSIRIPGLDKEVLFSLSWGLPPSAILYYTSADCTGQAYGELLTSYQIITSYDINPPFFPYFYVGQGALQALEIQSYLSPGMGYCNGPNGPPAYPWNMTLVPLTQVTLPFNTPVALPLKFKVGGPN